MTRATTRTAISTMTKSLTSSQKPSRTSGKASLKTDQEKNVSRTTGQPGLVRIQVARPPMTTTVESTAIAWPRRCWRRFAASRWRRRSLMTAGWAKRGGF